MICAFECSSTRRASAAATQCVSARASTAYINAQLSCAVKCSSTRRASAAAAPCICERRRKATRHHGLRFQLQLHCRHAMRLSAHAPPRSDAPSIMSCACKCSFTGEPQLLPCHAAPRTQAPPKRDAPSRAALSNAAPRGEPQLPPRRVSLHTRPPPKRRTIMSCAWQMQLHAASLSCRHAVRLFTRERRPSDAPPQAVLSNAAPRGEP